jgi:HD-GYP domain-containing protein (c-di-GMP phosphodiesterase class II)
MQKKKLKIESFEVDRDLLFQFVGHVIDVKIHSGYPGHSETDVHYAFQIARALNLDPDEVKLIKDAAYLHDIGKLAIPREILEKPAILTEKEWEIVKGHSSITIQLLEMVPSLRQYSFSGYHHERWDGKGYPKGLKAEEIPLGARVISVADALDAMTSKRPYRPTLTFKEALDELEKNAGTQFDPEVVSKTLQIFR